MAFALTPQPGEPGGQDERTEHVDERLDERKRLVADGVQVLARGAMLCPSCAIPISPAPQARPRTRMRCGWCNHAGVVADFVRGDVTDTVANEVRIVARVV